MKRIIFLLIIASVFSSCMNTRFIPGNQAHVNYRKASKEAKLVNRKLKRIPVVQLANK